jgi:hypothetical protein
MSEKYSNTAILEQEFFKTEKILEKMNLFYTSFTCKELPRMGRSTSSAIVMAEIFTDFYTCLETLFLRISRFFENSLSREKWHQDLLEKMTLEIKNVRIPLLREETQAILFEFLKFRHFKRYYFQFEYDWDKLDYLDKKYHQVCGLLKEDLEKFKAFLRKLQ